MIGKCKKCKIVYMSVLIGRKWFNVSEDQMRVPISRPKCCCPKCKNEMEQEWIEA